MCEVESVNFCMKHEKTVVFFYANSCPVCKLQEEVRAWRALSRQNRPKEKKKGENK